MNEHDGLIFDLDGTLWDAVEIYVEGWNNLFKQIEIERQFTRAWFMKMVGLNIEEFLKLILPHHDAQERIMLYELATQEHNNLFGVMKATIYPGVTEGLKLLSLKRKVFIVSNCPCDFIGHFKKQAKVVNYIDDSLCHGDNGKTKGENIRRIIDRYNLKNPVYIGDTESDGKESKKSGIPFYWVSYGYGTSKNYYGKSDSFMNLVSQLGDFQMCD